MSTKKRPVPDADHATPQFTALLAQLTDEQIETGVMARDGTAGGAAERHTAAALREHFADALLHQSLDRSKLPARASSGVPSGSPGSAP